ncbi:MAG: penicillin amidase [Deltaproteobacteria bacterium]|nr:penicillin amidase [Deltaproteobacteria bacterium]
MKTPRRLLLALLLLAFGISACSFLNSFQSEGTLVLPGLKAPVTVHRDEKGMAHIYAQDMHDAVMAQGFVTAQDRLFQMELTRLVATGRICEMAGEEARPLAIRMKTIGFLRNARKHAALLEPETRSFFQKYLDGVNAFIQLRPKEHHLEFKLAGIKPTPWSIEDSLAVAYLMSWDSAANLETEIIAQMLVEKLGPEKAKEIFPLNLNPDEPPGPEVHTAAPAWIPLDPGLAKDENLLAYLKDRSLGLGSNNWVVGPRVSAGARPIVANDPHLDARILPGPLYPIGLITPQVRAVGVNLPGLPGIATGRTDYVALGATNAYGDTQDLYVETVDPKDKDKYIEGGKSLPFETVEEILSIKDKNAPQGYREEKVKIRLTTRGPVISGVLRSLKTDKVMTLRFAPFESMDPCIGLHRILTATSIEELRHAIEHMNIIGFNFVFAARDGDIGWHVSGKLPNRSKGDGTIPFIVTDGQDNWAGYIPFDQMPHSQNPERAWIGTCNHKTVARDYPYYYSSHLSPSYRYERLKELLDTPNPKTAENHWQYQTDTVNLMAKRIAPLMAKALLAHEETKAMGEILSRWDYKDDPDKAAPAIFQAVYRHFAFLVLHDELGDDLARIMLNNWYFWQERLQAMVLEDTSPWFDDVKTDKVRETRDELFYQAGLKAAQDLGSSLGKDPQQWIWGKVHQMEFVSPIRRKGFGKGLVGGGSHPAPGSCESLYRGIYNFNEPFGVTVSAALRMVADLSDEDKILAVLPGGVCGRLFHPHTKDQVEAFMNGDKVYWWFSDKAIKEHTRAVLTLTGK